MIILFCSTQGVLPFFPSNKRHFVANLRKNNFVSDLLYALYLSMPGSKEGKFVPVSCDFFLYTLHQVSNATEQLTENRD